jgi:hypothetical protein
MRQRVRESGDAIHPDFDTFESFFAALGPKPSSLHTLDRINPSDPEYAPGKVRWADKREQSNNRKNTVFLTYDGTKFEEYVGKTKPLTEWASALGTSPSTLRRRRSDGWTDNEIIEGERAPRAKKFSEMSKSELLRFQPWPEDSREQDERRYLTEADSGENRFEFEQRVLLGEIWEKERYFLGTVGKTIDRVLEEEDFPSELRYEKVVPKSKSYINKFREQLNRLLDIEEDMDASSREEARWRKALDRFLIREKQDAAAKAMSRRYSLEDYDDE